MVFHFKSNGSSLCEWAVSCEACAIAWWKNFGFVNPLVFRSNGQIDKNSCACMNRGEQAKDKQEKALKNPEKYHLHFQFGSDSLPMVKARKKSSMPAKSKHQFVLSFDFCHLIEFMRCSTLLLTLRNDERSKDHNSCSDCP